MVLKWCSNGVQMVLNGAQTVFFLSTGFEF